MKEILEIFWTFFKIGLTTFGGGFALIANLTDVVVSKKKWLTNDEMLEMIAIGESTPGTIALNVSTFVGYKRKKIFGSIVATLGFVLPSFIIIILISLFLKDFLTNQYVAYAFMGIKCAVGILIVKVGLNFSKTIEKSKFNIILFIVGFITCFLIQLFNINFSSIFIILIAGLISFTYYSIITRREK